MEIQGPNFGVYDSRYLQVTQRETAHSVKPQLFREVDDSVSNALQLTNDVIALSPEAKELMQMLKKYGRNSKELEKFIKSRRMKDLIYSFKELRDLVYGEDEDEEEGDAAGGRKKKKKNKGTPIEPNQYFFQLSGKPKGKAGRGMSWSSTNEMVEKMIVHSPNEQSKRALARELEVLGDEIIDTVKRFGVKIIILARNVPLTDIRIGGMSVVAPGEKTFDGRPWSIVRGLYDNSRRLIVMGEENIGLRHSTARHEFAHAFDHTFSEKHGRRLPLSVQLWNLFRKEREGLISDYAGTNPQEYFAEAVEAYFREDGRQKLLMDDSKMYEYLESLFGVQ